MSRNPFRKGKTVGFYEVMATPYTDGGGANSDSATYSKGNPMESYKAPSKMASDGSPRNVGFTLKDQHTEKKKKYLTAKYGQHQMLLIKKRLRVEMWIFDELRKLYNSEDDDHDCELELEDLLNLETDSERKQYALEQLQDARQSQDDVNRFVEELLKQAKTL
ncbi:uncharacterized protein LOC101853466 [Aplysia californica]|uniref:Uncharacterized protein LOC101853466 n=1 Tax=Aplysia californica TaxID=6500 RepID=A0ABM0JTL3_APLCA|nr:uncharacterized protein LOC101853466 [Aplysia californica]